MSVELDPPELGFKRPFTQEVSQVLRLHNPTSDPIAFKVKTTAPKQYCVRPNSGRIEAGRNVEVQVLLQAMKEDPPPDARCRDKFLVQSVAVTPDKDFNNVSQIWSSIEQSAKSSIQEKKIRVTFLPADDSSGAAAGVAAASPNGLAPHHDDDLPPYSSPSQHPTAVSPTRGSTQAPSGAVSSFADKPVDATSRGDAVESAHNPATDNNNTTTLGSTAAAISSAIPTSSSDVQRQLEAANAKVQQLQQQVTEGLRQRRVGGVEDGQKEGTTSGGNMGLHNAPAPGGVPVQYVAALCLLCFLIAYLLF